MLVSSGEIHTEIQMTHTHTQIESAYLRSLHDSQVKVTVQCITIQIIEMNIKANGHKHSEIYKRDHFDSNV